MNFSIRQITIILSLLLLVTGCKSVKDQAKVDEFFNVEKLFDTESETYYYLTKINHVTKDGKLIKLQHAHSIKEDGETVREFAHRANCTLAFNASTQRSLSPRKPSGVQIVNGKIVQDIKTTAYTLGIRDDNQLLAYKPNIRAATILKDGVNNALTAFGPLIENHQSVNEETLKIRENYSKVHPRQVIAQFDNLDILFLSCGGRGFDGKGMTAKDVVRILLKKNVKFAYMLDGGGSTSTVINKELITKKIDENGTQERLRPNFLYVE